MTTLWCSAHSSTSGATECWHTHLPASAVADQVESGFWIPLCNSDTDPTPSGGYLNPRYIVRVEA